MSDIHTVRDLTERLRRGVEGMFPFVWVKGEVSNLSRPSSGHVYFSLKDADALLQCVWFRGRQRGEEHFDPLTGEVFEDGPRPSLALSVKNGQQLLCAGRITVYAPRGAYQMVVELAQDEGQGRLFAQLEALKRRLAERGFFALERKRPLPGNPRRVAVITAPGGAAIHDFLRIAASRGCGAEMRLHPVPVQGAGAAPAIAAALREANVQGWAQAIALIRGGGSLEDLWAFNEEAVAEAVFCSALPVVAGIGHEVDVSIADMTADVRAATPSHAAQLLWAARAELAQMTDALETALRAAMERGLEARRLQWERYAQALAWHSPVRVLDRLRDGFQVRHERLIRAGKRMLESREEWVRRLEEQLPRAAAGTPRKLHAQLEQMAVRLAAASPLAPLERGYALVRDARGEALRSVTGVRPGDAVGITLRDGELAAQVTAVEAEGP